MRLLTDLRAKQAPYLQYGQHCSFAGALISDRILANALYRLQATLCCWHFAPLALLPHCLNKLQHACVIGVRAQFDPGFVLIHPVGVVINSAVRGGRDVRRPESGVEIGDNRGRSPSLGVDVFVDYVAKIIGGVKVGDGARIGANAVLFDDVAPGAKVVGIAARTV